MVVDRPQWNCGAMTQEDEGERNQERANHKKKREQKKTMKSKRTKKALKAEVAIAEKVTKIRKTMSQTQLLRSQKRTIPTVSQNQLQKRFHFSGNQIFTIGPELDFPTDIIHGDRAEVLDLQT